MDPAEIARGWDVAGDWLADLVTIEAEEEAELARQLAPVLFAAGVSSPGAPSIIPPGAIPRGRDEERIASEAC